MSCNIPRRVYLNNQTDKPITLLVDSSFKPDAGTIAAAFRDSLDHKRLEPGAISINFGAGKWKKPDEESLIRVLKNLQVQKEGNPGTFRLPHDIRIGHGILIPELIVRINEP